jgi:hypothetical protein
LAELLSHHPDHTDGSFLQGSAGSAFVYNGQAFSYRLLCFNSVSPDSPVVADILLWVSSWRTSGHSVDAVACLAGTSQTELLPLTFVLAFVALFYPRG